MIIYAAWEVSLPVSSPVFFPFGSNISHSVPSFDLALSIATIHPTYLPT